MSGLEEQVAKSLAKVTKDVYKDVARPVFEGARPGLVKFGEGVGACFGMAGWALGVLPNALDALRDVLRRRVAPKLDRIPDEYLSEPNPAVAVPIAHNLLLCEGEDVLAEAFASLFATHLDKRRVLDAHPAFAHIISTLSPDEVRIIHYTAQLTPPALYHGAVRAFAATSDGGKTDVVRYFTGLAYRAGCEHSELEELYLSNLIRAGLVYDAWDAEVADREIGYRSVENSQFIRDRFSEAGVPLTRMKCERGLISWTSLGRSLRRSVCGPKDGTTSSEAS